MKRDSIALAVEYSRDVMDAPRVSARGTAEAAKEMRRAAVRYGIPIVDDSALAARLAEPGQSHAIDRRLFQEVAELFLDLERPKRV